jgi:hypothetical protein
VIVRAVFLWLVCACSGSGYTPPQATFNITGTWLGDWYSDAAPDGWPMFLDFWHGGQEDSRVMGSVSLLGFTYGDVEGGMDGQEITFALHYDEGVIVFAGTLPGPFRMEGSFTVTAGDLTGYQGEWEVRRHR